MGIPMELTKLARAMRLRGLQMAYSVGKKGAHLGSGFSTVEIMAVLYGAIMKYDAKNPFDINRDRLIVSKGHCVLAYYTALLYAGFLSNQDLDSFETNGSLLHGHATRDLQHGIEFSGGSLSMGLSYGVGIAIACKKLNLKNHIYIIVGDGECNEGLVWEALMSASNFNLNNLTVIMDCNKLQYDGPTEDIMNPGSWAEKFETFGFQVLEIDGHDVIALQKAANSKSPSCPNAIIAHTIKGKGVTFMEGKKEWHLSLIHI